MRRGRSHAGRGRDDSFGLPERQLARARLFFDAGLFGSDTGIPALVQAVVVNATVADTMAINAIFVSRDGNNAASVE